MIKKIAPWIKRLPAQAGSNSRVGIGCPFPASPRSAPLAGSAPAPAPLCAHPPRQACLLDSSKWNCLPIASERMSGEQNGEQNEQNCWRYIPTYVAKRCAGRFQVPTSVTIPRMNAASARGWHDVRHHTASVVTVHSFSALGMSVSSHMTREARVRSWIGGGGGGGGLAAGTRLNTLA